MPNTSTDLFLTLHTVVFPLKKEICRCRTYRSESKQEFKQRLRYEDFYLWMLIVYFARESVFCL